MSRASEKTIGEERRFASKSGVMVQEKIDLESLLSRANERQKAYDWKTAAEAYSRASAIVPAKDPLRLGNVAESGAHALYRYAFQAETREEFNERIAEAVEQYGKAREAYRRLDSKMSVPWSRRCDAMTAFLGSWSVATPAERKRLIGESWSHAKDAMNAFEEAGDYSQLRRTNSLLTLVVSIGYAYSADSKFRENLIREGLEYSEKAVRSLSDGEDKTDIARAFIDASYYTRLLCSDFIDIEHRGEWDSKAGELWRKGLELSEEGSIEAIANDYKFGILPSTVTPEETRELRRHALENATRTKDLLRKAALFEWRETGAFLEAHETVDPDQRDSLANEALSCAEEARRCYSITSSVYLSEAVFWSGAPKSGFYALKASLETDLEKKREFAQKGVEAFEEGLRTAEECDYPEGAACVHGDATQILFNLARTEGSSENKKRVLERALNHGRQHLDMWKSLHPFDYGTMGGMASLADIEHELAEVATDSKERSGLWREAISLMKEAYEGLRKEAKFGSVSVERWSRLKLGEYQYQIANWSLQLYGISKDRSDLVSAAEAFQNAIELYRIADKPSRVAESYWKAAQTQDALGDYLGASERFAMASDSYKQAAEMIPPLKGLYLEHSSYMQAWSEIEKAVYHHAKQEPASSKEHYNRAAELHESTEKWSFLSNNYFAWAQVENAEDLSQRERCIESIEAFREAARLFKDSKSKMREQLAKIEINDEKQMVEKLIDAADNREQLCKARVALEEARLLDKRGDLGSASEKYGLVADMFTKIKQALTADQDRKEIELIVTLSKAWKAMAKAEADASPEEYAEAARLFEAAKLLSPGEKAKALALGHSRFCKALEAGARFADTRNPTLHASAIKHLDSAANHYARAGAESASEYSRASKLLFDAYGSMDRAGQETDHEKKAKAYLAVEKILEASAAGFAQAEQPGKKDQVLRLLESVKREREFAVSLTELLRAPLFVSSTASFASPSPTHEQSVGLERFERADIQANLIAPNKELKVDEDLILGIELVNAGRGPAQLIKLQDLVPKGFSLQEEPEGYRMEDSYLNLRGKRLDPLKTEEINLVLKPTHRGQFVLKPRILYLDESGKYKSHEPEPMRVTVGVEATAPAGKGVHEDAREAAEARALLAGLNVVTLSHYRIVGNYVRYGGVVCNALKDARQKIVAACQSSSPKRENYIIWAPPGSGKTYFVQEVAALLGDCVHYRELNLAKLDEAGFRSALAELRIVQRPCLCLVDEVDSKPDESWPYEALMPFLDASATEGARLVFVLAGSSGSSLEEMKKMIASRPKGPDILSRVPTDNEYTIPPMGVGDRLLVVLSQFRQAGKQMGHEVREVEKLGLYYVALNPRLSNARQLREFAVRCAERVLPGDDRLKYDSLFHPGDLENKLFWTQALQSAGALVGSFLLVED